MELYTELIERSKNARFKIVPRSQVGTAPRKYEAYSSLFLFGPEILEHMEMTKDKTYTRGNVAGYAGRYFTNLIVFDFDGEEGDLDQPQIDARNLARKLITQYNVPRELIYPYFSGAKGFHLAMPAGIFGHMEPSNQLPSQVKRLTEELAGEFETLDSSLCAPNRYFRLPNSLHRSTNLYKIPLTLEELVDLDPVEIAELASTPRTANPYESFPVNTNDKLAAVWKVAQSAPEKYQADKAVIETMPEGDGDRFAMAVQLAETKKEYEEGNRNNFVFYLAALCNDLGIGERGDGESALELINDYLESKYGDGATGKRLKELEATVLGAYNRKKDAHGSFRVYLKEKRHSDKTMAYKAEIYLTEKAQNLSRRSQLRMNEILEILMDRNAQLDHPATEEKVHEIVVRSVRGRANRKDGHIGYTVSDLSEKWVERYSRVKADLKTGIFPFDQAERGDLRGRAIAIIGPGGIGKSALALQIAETFAENGFRALYSTMEDTGINQFSRVLNGIGAYQDPDTQKLISASEATKMQIKTLGAKEVIQVLKDHVGSKYGTNLMFDEEPRMCGDDYDWLVNAHIQKYGRLDGLFVDGLSLMQSSGNETLDAGQNSADLKVVSNKYDLPLFALVHIGREAKIHNVRNLEDFARGSDKIKDNFDAFISLSYCEDFKNSTPGSPSYHPNLVYMKYWGKRTSGKTFETILERDSITMEYRHRPDINPAHFNDQTAPFFLDGYEHAGEATNDTERPQAAPQPGNLSTSQEQELF